MTHKITRFLTLFLLVSLGGCTVQSEHHVPENAAFCDDLPYLDYADTLAGKTAEQFRESMHQRFQQAADMGINTVYL
ncbi:MAG: hypothetical protein ACLT3Y_09360, partial [Ruminococcus callidus]